MREPYEVLISTASRVFVSISNDFEYLQGDGLRPRIHKCFVCDLDVKITRDPTISLALSALLQPKVLKEKGLFNYTEINRPLTPPDSKLLTI